MSAAASAPGSAPGSRPVRLGRISYLNVLPIYHPLEAGWVSHGFEVVSGPPAKLNGLIRAGELDLSACSSIEYARNPERYVLLPDLAIGSFGPVKSVLLVSRVPLARLAGESVLVTAESHTSAALLRIVLERVYGVRPAYRDCRGPVRQAMALGADDPAALAIGDEALALRGDPRFPYQLDLGEVWRDWTGLPFVFGVWVARREAVAERPEELAAAARLLVESKRAGVAAIEEMASLASLIYPKLTRAEIRRYFGRLVYDLGELEQQGLSRFFQCLAEHGFIESPPSLDILGRRQGIDSQG
ncbi:Chorismate dehydratase [Fundidesulfovibrio magnetotacticus]|uniref:Chorismate dehydratase n=1 Tax=Fundidesulfovibrio magnetotacticus TaxID=2730080 RepID=A0A6V8M098_9BACT|nr:menaquinone biosynthesis protein [Fundidesulfovibrio magnetotacticus]GFK95888.1 Chorismate dehydratase [Fundidesulfovibrio magnetotacticus]